MADGPVVSNTSPRIKLAGVGLLDLPPLIYAEIWVPEAVRQEYAVGRRATDPDIDTLAWLKIHPITTALSVPTGPNLHAGELAAIALASQTHARALILDDRNARKVAEQLGLPIVGTLALLVRAKRRSIIPLVKPIVDQMIAQGRYISPALRARVLRDAGEPDATL